MAWQRLGRIHEPAPFGGWASSHAMMPIFREDDEGLWVYFTARDGQGRSHVAKAHLDFDGADSRLTPLDEPLLSPGELGAFDDSGAGASCLVDGPDGLLLYYVGWSLRVTVPFALFVGCARSTDGGRSFQRVSRAPVVGPSAADPLLATAPWVLRDGERWRMWYTSAERWEVTPAGPKHHYRIVDAESPDGIHWEPTGNVCIDFADAEEYAIGRPCVLRDGDLYRMWFSCRGEAYRIGYAESADGVTWTRDEPRGGLRPAGPGWESRSVEYGCVFDYSGERWMLYNGNEYGKTGVGLARWEATA